MSSVVELLAGAPFKALSALSDALGGADPQGLTIAAKWARRRGLISPNIARRMERLDLAAHMVRHCTGARMQAIMLELDSALQGKAKSLGAEEQEVSEKKVVAKASPPRLGQGVQPMDTKEEGSAQKADTTSVPRCNVGSSMDLPVDEGVQDMGESNYKRQPKPSSPTSGSTKPWRSTKEMEEHEGSHTHLHRTSSSMGACAPKLAEKGT